MSDLGHTHHTDHHHGVQHQAVPQVVTTTVTTTSKKTVTTHKGPAPVHDTQASAGTTGTSPDTSQALIFLGLPILASPGKGLTSADMFALVDNALDKHRKTQVANAVKLDRSNMPDLQKNTFTVSKEVPVKDAHGNDVKDSQGNTVTTTVTQTYSTLSLHNSVLGTIANNLAHELFGEVEQHVHGKKAPLTMNLVQAFVHQVLTSGTILSIMPSLDLLGSDTKPQTFSINEGKVNIASTASFAKLISNSGPAFEAFAKLLLPNDKAAAKILADAAKSIFTGLALHEVGQALGLPGLADQVDKQAKVVRNESAVVHTVAFRRDVVPGLVTVVAKQLPQLSKTEIQNRIDQALNQVASQGEFNTRQELLAALRDAFKKVFPGQVQLIDDLATKTEKNALDSALASTNNVYTPQFDVSKLNVQNITDSIINTILQEFAKSDQAIRDQAHADALANTINKADIKKAINHAVINGQIQNEQDVRNVITQELVNQGFSQADAEKIANQTNVLPPALPLASSNNPGVLNPRDFKKEVNQALLANNISPNSPLGSTIEDLFGVSDHPKSTNMIGLINSDYRASQRQSDNYLNLRPAQQGIQQELNFLDPGKKLVIEWGAVMNGTPEHEDHKRTSNNTV